MSAVISTHLIRKDICTCFQIIWMTFIWIIWKEHHIKKFQDKQSSIVQIVDKVKLHSWGWFKVYMLSLFFDFHV